MFEPTVLFQGYFYGQNLETFEQMRSFVEFQIPVTFQWKGFQGSFQKFLLIGVLHDCFMKYNLNYINYVTWDHIECSHFSMTVVESYLMNVDYIQVSTVLINVVGVQLLVLVVDPCE